MAPSAPWSDLPIDILLDIFKPLELPDLIRVSAVCSSCNHAASALCPKIKQNHSPWLLIGSTEDKGDKDDEFYSTYYSLSEEKVYRVPTKEEFSSWYVIDSSHGWLVKADEMSNLHLINPITGRLISLPPVTTMEDVSAIFDDQGNVVKYDIRDVEEIEVYQMRNQYSKVVLSKDPSEGGFVVLLVRFSPDYQPEFRTRAQILFTKQGDKGWTLLDETTRYMDFVFYEDLFYGVTELGGIDSIDLTDSSSPTINTIVIEDDDSDVDDLTVYEEKLYDNILARKYILLTPENDVLVIWRKEIHGKQVELKIYKIDVETKRSVEIDNIEDCSIFIGENAGCFCAKNSPSMKPNSIYLVEPGKCEIYNMSQHSFEEEKAFSNLIGDYGPYDIWLTPTIQK